MAQDVVINGTTYPAVEAVTLADGNGNTTMFYPDAVRYVEQNLTTNQQARARKNIGAVSKDGLSLGIHTDGLVYLFVDGVPVGTGIELPTAGDVVGYVDSGNNIVLSGLLADGSYTVKYEMENGTVLNIGNLSIDTNVYHTITNNLTKCSNSNVTAKVVSGDKYSATITANDGYELSSVKVTMGGTDISSTAVSGGKITIASVTGNIIITAVATEKVVAITNLAVTNATNKTDWSLWCNDARIGSDGAYRAASGQVVTNWIEVAVGDTLYIKGLSFTADTHNAYIYNSSKTKLNGGTMAFWKNNGFGDFTTVNGITTFKPTNVSQNNGMAYVRFGAALTGTLSDVIITKNQPIE